MKKGWQTKRLGDVLELQNGYAFDSKDDNGGQLYTAAEIKQKIKSAHQSDGDSIWVNSRWVGIDDYFKTNYAKNKIKKTHAPKTEDGIYTIEQREKFKASVAGVLTQLQSKSAEISEQIGTLTLGLGASPWTPKEYQDSHLAGLKGNLQELEKFQNTLNDIMSGYDKLLTTSDTEKLTDPQA